MFINYQNNKLLVHHPDHVNIIIIVVLVVLSMLMVKKKRNHTFLDIITTEQIRGAAILMVVLGHLWVHVAEKKPVIILSGDGVAFFLFLSGFGFVSSYQKRQPDLKAYITSRINRVMIPYWFATIFILSLDRIFLNRIYNIFHICLTFLGINVYGVMHHFDYVRWYITFLLFWYGVAFFVYRYVRFQFAAYFLLGVGFFAFLINYYIAHFGWYQFLAFPMGCIVAENKDACAHIADRFRNKNAYWLALLAIVAFMLATSYPWKEYLSGLPSICNVLVSDFTSLLFTLCLISIFEVSRYFSQMLIIFGKYSYEIFLLHGVFLIKYNPFLQLTFLPVAFGIYLLFVLMLSVGMKSILGNVKISLMQRV